MDKTQKNIELLRGKLTDYFASDNTGHGIDHLERALKYAFFSYLAVAFACAFVAIITPPSYIMISLL